MENSKRNYIFVNTDFKRANEPVFILGILEGIRRLSLQKELKEKSFDEIKSAMTQKIQEHYLDSGGRLTIWGDIKNYVLHFNGKSYLFDTNGLYLGENDSVRENQAVLSI
jgi:hypothetical protein